MTLDEKRKVIGQALSDRQVHVLSALPHDRWFKPKDVGGRAGSHHSNTLKHLARRGFADVRREHVEGCAWRGNDSCSCRGILSYQASRAGRDYMAARARAASKAGELSGYPLSFGDPRLPERFWSKVSPEPNSGCWLWTGSATRDGYGTMAVGSPGQRRTCALSHRVAFSASGQVIQDGLELDHLCRVRCCVNPLHLDPVTRSVNVLRGFRARRERFGAR